MAWRRDCCWCRHACRPRAFTACRASCPSSTRPRGAPPTSCGRSPAIRLASISRLWVSAKTATSRRYFRACQPTCPPKRGARSGSAEREGGSSARHRRLRFAEAAIEASHADAFCALRCATGCRRRIRSSKAAIMRDALANRGDATTPVAELLRGAASSLVLLDREAGSPRPIIGPYFLEETDAYFFPGIHRCGRRVIVRRIA